MITAALEAEIDARRDDGWRVDVHPTDATSRPEFLARHVYGLLRRALEAIHGDDDAQVASQVALANRLVEALFEHGAMANDRVAEAAGLLLEAADRRGMGGPPPSLPRPTLSFRRTGLLVNGRRDVQIASEIAREIPSADRIDLLCAFVRHSGLRLFRSELEARAQAGAQVRVIASVYTGSTERRALDALIALGARVKVSYEIARTRLHAKAWLFRRDSGLHTAYIGSSNLTHMAQVDGLEWNVRVSAAENPEVIERFEATFEQYWQEPEFEEYEPGRDADSALQRIRESVELRREINDLLDILDDRIRTVAQPLDGTADVPLASHATYSLGEIAAAHGRIDKRGALALPQAGVLWDEATQTDLLFVTLEKSDADFSPTTRYADYPISPTLFHWESQNSASADTPTGRRYVEQSARGTNVVLFVRERKRDGRGVALP